jgi:hypothetical protein
MKGAREKGLAIILGRLSKPKEESAEKEGDDYTAAAEEVMSALKAEDAEGFATALKSFITMCQAEG